MDDVFGYSRMIALWFTTFFLLLLRYFKVVQTKQNKKRNPRLPHRTHVYKNYEERSKKHTCFFPKIRGAASVDIILLGIQ